MARIRPFNLLVKPQDSDPDIAIGLSIVLNTFQWKCLLLERKLTKAE